MDALIGMCYDGVEGLLYLSLFSLLAACALSAMLCTILRVWMLMGSRSAPSDPLILLHTARNALLQSVNSGTSSVFSVSVLSPGTESMTTLMRRIHLTLKCDVCPTTLEGPTSTVFTAIQVVLAARPAFHHLHNQLLILYNLLNTCKIKMQ